MKNKAVIIFGFVLMCSLAFPSSSPYAGRSAPHGEEEEYTGESTPDVIHVKRVTATAHSGHEATSHPAQPAGGDHHEAGVS